MPPYVYQGEELGMTNAHFTSFDSYRDWDNSPQAGFTTGEPWIAVNPNHRTINADAEWMSVMSSASSIRRSRSSASMTAAIRLPWRAR